MPLRYIPLVTSCTSPAKYLTVHWIYIAEIYKIVCYYCTLTDLNQGGTSLTNNSTNDAHQQLPYDSSSNNLYFEEMQEASPVFQTDRANNYMVNNAQESSYGSTPSSTSPETSRCTSPNISHTTTITPSQISSEVQLLIEGCYSFLPVPPPTPTNPFSVTSLTEGERRRRKLRSPARRNLY